MRHHTSNEPTSIDEFETDADPATQLTGGEVIEKTTSGDDLKVIRANPFEVYVENMTTGRRKSLDTRRVSNGPYVVG